MKRFFAVMAVALLSLVVSADDEVKISSGIGSTDRAAVDEALVSALEMQQGVAFSATERSEIVAASASVASSSGDEDRTEVNDAIKKSMQKWAKGKISGYEVLSDEFDPQTKKYRVTLSVRSPIITRNVSVFRSQINPLRCSSAAV